MHIPEAFHNDVWSSTNGRDWTRVCEHAPWAARGMVGGSAVHRGRLWILGGGTYDTPGSPERRFYNDVWSTADGVHWEQHIEQAPWSARQYHDVAVFDDRLWVLEGWNKGNRNDVWHSADGVRWEELPGTPWAPRHASSLFVHDNALWVVAGNNMTPDVWKLVRVGVKEAGDKRQETSGPSALGAPMLPDERGGPPAGNREVDITHVCPSACLQAAMLHNQ